MTNYPMVIFTWLVCVVAGLLLTDFFPMNFLIWIVFSMIIYEVDYDKSYKKSREKEVMK